MVSWIRAAVLGGFCVLAAGVPARAEADWDGGDPAQEFAAPVRRAARALREFASGVAASSATVSEEPVSLIEDPFADHRQLAAARHVLAPRLAAARFSSAAVPRIVPLAPLIVLPTPVAPWALPVATFYRVPVSVGLASAW